MRIPLIALAAALSSLAAAASLAAEPQHLNGKPGVPLALAVETAERSDCSVGGLPEMKVLVAPAHGELTLREGDLRRRGSACPSSPGYVVLYVPDDDFNGADTIAIQLSGGVEDQPTTLAFDIDVEGKVAPPSGGV